MTSIPKLDSLKGIKVNYLNELVKKVALSPKALEWAKASIRLQLLHL